MLGGTQALSRSLYASMIPEEASAEFFGFYSVFSKFASIWGPLLFALVNDITGSSRNAILSLIVFFALGLPAAVEGRHRGGAASQGALEVQGSRRHRRVTSAA